MVALDETGNDSASKDAKASSCRTAKHRAAEGDAKREVCFGHFLTRTKREVLLHCVSINYTVKHASVVCGNVCILADKSVI